MHARKRVSWQDADLDTNTAFRYTVRYGTAIRNGLSGKVPETPEKRFPFSQGGVLMGEEKKGNVCMCVVVAGIILLAIGLLADVIGLGKDPGFGPQQTAVIVVGVVILVLGLKFGSKMCLCKRKK